MYDNKILELNKILEEVKDNAFLEVTKKRILDLTPSNDLSFLNKTFDYMDEAYNSIERMANLPLDFIVDVKMPIKRSLVGSILSSKEIYNVGILISKIRSLLKYKKDCENLKVNITNLNEFYDNLTDDKKLENEIISSINDNFEVLDRASMPLFKIRKRIQMEENHLRSYMNSLLLSKSKMLTDNVIALRNGRMTLMVKADYKNAISGIIHDSSASGTTFFIEPSEANNIYNTIESLKHDEQKEVNNVLKGLSLLIENSADHLLVSILNIEELDFIFAKAKWAKENEYTKPILNSDGYINIIDGAHPLIDKDKVVKNSVELGRNYSTIIITGPNTGGKTVVLKLVGLLTLMALSGLFIPCKKNSSISVFDNVLADIGDEQSIEQNLSTFSSHMTRITNIFKKVNANSLVLLDEVGSGTDPKEGASLAIAIIDKLTKIGARVISTTHYSDLKAYAYNNKKTVNASVEFNSETLVPTYKLSIGIPGLSNALSISKRLGLDADILLEAKKLLNSNSSESSELISKIDEENKNIIKLREEYEQKLKSLNKSKSSFLREKNELEKNRELLVYKAHLEANKIIEDAKEKSADLIEKLNSLKKEKSIEDKDLAQIKYESKNLKAKEQEKKEDTYVLSVGDLVHVIDYHKVGQVLEIKKNKYLVQFGQFKMFFKRKELEYDKSLKKEEDKRVFKKPSTTLATESASMKLDLRGERYVDVASMVDIFIDRAILAHYNTVQIIHGFGTGAVRKAVYEALKKNKNVKDTRFGKEGEGLNGCTVVTLK